MSNFVGGNHPPYESPCGVSEPEFQPRPTHSHWRDKPIPRFTNATTVPNYVAGQPPISPYPRLNPADYPGIGGCPSPVTCGDPVTPNGNPLCGPWPDRNPQCSALDAPDAFPASAQVPGAALFVDGNTYVASAGFFDPKVCLKIGFKNVQAKKVAQGNPAFIGVNVGDDSYTPCETGCGPAAYATPRYSPVGVRYRQIVFSGFKTDSSTGLSIAFSQTFTIDTLTGRIDLTAHSETHDATNDPSDTQLAALINGTITANARIAGVVAAYDAIYEGIVNGGIHVADLTETCSTGYRQLTWNWTDAGLNTISAVTGTFTVGTNSATWNLDQLDTAVVGGGSNHELDYITLSPTDYVSEKKNVVVPPSGPTITTVIHMEIHQSNAYAIDDVLADAYVLTALWDMTKDDQYPWRHDAFVGIAPLVTRREKSSPATVIGALWPMTVDDKTSINTPSSPGNPPTYNPRNWFDPGYWCWVQNGVDANGYPTYSGLQVIPEVDGSIKGGPLPAGYGPHFDKDHRTWKQCGGSAPYIHAYGAWSASDSDNDPTDAAVPMTATQWTENNPEAGTYPGGHWVIYGAGVVAVQKWVQTKDTRPSWNWARPCGADKTALDEPTVVCVAGVAGNVVQTVSAFAGGAVVGVAGVPGVADGVYSGSNADATHYTLVTKLRDFVKAPILTGSGIIGKIRFPTCPSICGRIKVVGASNASPIVITTAEAHNLATGETVDITGVLGNTNANGPGLTVTAIDATSFSLDGIAGNADYIGRGYVSSTDAAAYQFNDNYPKGTFVAIQYVRGQRDINEADRACLQSQQNACCASAPAVLPGGASCVAGSCIGGSSDLRIAQTTAPEPVQRDLKTMTITEYCIYSTQCSPTALCYSPNGEVFPHGLTLPVVDPGPLDDLYGNFSQGVFITELDDFFWQPSHVPCADCTLGGGSIGPTCCPVTEDLTQGVGPCPDDVCPDDCDCSTPPAGYFYPHRPKIEARSGKPGMFPPPPDMPAGYPNMAWLSLAQIAAHVTPGIVAPPPDGPGYGTDDNLTPQWPLPPWAVWLAEHECVCADGKFADSYRQDGVCC